VKVVEFGSMTCNHCADFAEEGEPQLIEKYVKSGQVSFEFRNFVRDPADIAASLLARCNGASAFFPLTDQLYAAQGEWVGKLQQMSPEQQAQLETMDPRQDRAHACAGRRLIDFVRCVAFPRPGRRPALPTPGR
jgi:protein-disulfide isomerase